MHEGVVGVEGLHDEPVVQGLALHGQLARQVQALLDVPDPGGVPLRPGRVGDGQAVHALPDRVEDQHDADLAGGGA